MQPTQVTVLDCPIPDFLEKGATLPFQSFEALASDKAYSLVTHDQEVIAANKLTVEVEFLDETDEGVTMMCAIQLHRNGAFGIQDFIGQLMVDVGDWLIDPKEQDNLGELQELARTLSLMDFTIH